MKKYRDINIAIIGRPNSGKTTLFNKLTKSYQAIGNYSGVTVDKITKSFRYKEQRFNLIDLPGCVSLVSVANTSKDEQITCNFVKSSRDVDLYISVVDYNYLQGDLYLTLQLLEQVQIPAVVVFTKVPKYVLLNKTNCKPYFFNYKKKIEDKIGNVNNSNNINFNFSSNDSYEKFNTNDEFNVIDDSSNNLDVKSKINICCNLNIDNILIQKEVAILSEKLSSDVVLVNVKKNLGLTELKEKIFNIGINQITCVNSESVYVDRFKPKYLSSYINVVKDLEVAEFNKQNFAYLNFEGIIVNALEGDNWFINNIAKATNVLDAKNTIGVDSVGNIETKINIVKEKIKNLYKTQCDIAIAMSRHEYISELLSKFPMLTLRKNIHKCSSKDICKFSRTNTLTKFLDNIVLNRILSLPIFFGLMYLMFVFSINLGEKLGEYFDFIANVVVIDSFKVIAEYFNLPDIISTVLVDGLGRGVVITVNFIPILFLMFLFLAFLESSGYIPRASFIMDRFLRFLGLPGKALIPMIVGFGCNVPGVLSARTLENRNDRILTILMTPFMSCSARLAVYTLFVTTFFPKNGQNIIFTLYIIGILAAIFTGLLLKRTLLRSSSTPFIMELPYYRLPSILMLFRLAYHRLHKFLVKAFKLIVPICMIIALISPVVMNSNMHDNSFSSSNSSNVVNSKNILNTKNIGNFVNPLRAIVYNIIMPIFKPMGIKSENWPAVATLFTGIFGKEVMVGTLNSLYLQGGNASNNSVHSLDIKESILVENDKFQKKKIERIIYSKFSGTKAAFAYLIFVLLYVPCISVVVTIVRELDIKWAIFSIMWSTSLAYVFASMFYQIATFSLHPFFSSIWLASISAIGFGCYKLISRYTCPERLIKNQISTKVAINFE